MRFWLLRIVIGILLIPFLVQCKHLDYLRTGVAGKNLLQVITFGDHPIDLAQLKKITLKGFSIGDFSHPLVHKHLRLYERHGKKTLEAIMRRGAFYLPTIKRIFKAQGVPEELAYLPVIESGYRNKAISSASAVGMWQFTYDTGILYKLRANYWYDERSDFYKATIASAYHLKYLYRVFDDWLLVLAAYNAGVGKISRAIKRYKTRNFWELIENSYIKGETANYVPKFIASLTLLQNPERYGLNLPPEIPERTMKKFKVEDAVEIKLLIEASGMPAELFHRYNPSLLKWATPPKRACTLYIPAEYYDRLVTNLEKIPVAERVTFREYFIKIGDTLSIIAKRLELPPNPIAEINKLASLDQIQAGEILILPVQGQKKALDLDKSLSSNSNNQIVTLSRQGTNTRIGRRTKRRLRDQLLTPQSTHSSNADFPRAFIHVLAPEDTLYVLARRYRVSLEDLMQWNGLRSSRALRSGKHLIIYLPQ